MQILMMSSSKTEVTSNGVPSLFVRMRMHILFWRFVSSNRTQSLAEAVLEEVADILGELHTDVFNFDSVGSTRFYNKHILAKLLYVETHDAIGMLKITRNIAQNFK